MILWFFKNHLSFKGCSAPRASFKLCLILLSKSLSVSSHLLPVNNQKTILAKRGKLQVRSCQLQAYDFVSLFLGWCFVIFTSMKGFIFEVITSFSWRLVRTVIPFHYITSAGTISSGVISILKQDKFNYQRSVSVSNQKTKQSWQKEWYDLKAFSYFILSWGNDALSLYQWMRYYLG